MSLLAAISPDSLLQSVHLLDASNAEVQYFARASKSTVHFPPKPLKMLNLFFFYFFFYVLEAEL